MAELVRNRGYFLIMDAHGDEVRIPEHFFKVLDKDGNHVDPTKLDRSDELDLRLHDDDHLDIVHVSVDAGVEVIHRAHVDSNFRGYSDWKLVAEYDDGETAMFRREPDEDVEN
ncbi:MAG: hypothetical protein J0I19_16710 [Alphaproteobacteria bacterium]|nr:hypothetical protein [Alphaproteobacteria bacterium]